MEVGRYHRCNPNAEGRDGTFEDVSNFHHAEITGWRRRIILGAHAGWKILHHHVRRGGVHSRVHHQRPYVSRKTHALGRLEVFVFRGDSIGLGSDRCIHGRVRNGGRIEQDWLSHRFVKTRGYDLCGRPGGTVHRVHLYDTGVHDASGIQHRINDGGNDSHGRSRSQLFHQRERSEAPFCSPTHEFFCGARSQSAARVAHASCEINRPRMKYSTRKVTQSCRFRPATRCTFR